jgi:hypothetical protein
MIGVQRDSWEKISCQRKLLMVGSKKLTGCFVHLKEIVDH